MVIIEEIKKENTLKLQKKTIKEPILNDNDPKWLYVIFKESIPEDDRKIKQALEKPLPLETKTIFEIKNPGIWQCKRCGATIQSIKEKPHYCSECKRESNFEQNTETIDPDLWKLPIWKDIPVEDLDMHNTFIDMLQTIKQCLIFPEEIQYKLYTLWIISTWKTGNWETIPFLIFRGLIETGKTRALDLISELGYRTIQASGISIKAVFRFGDIYGANILIDEIDNKIDHRTESGREMIDYLKPSYRTGSYYYAADRENPKKIQKYKNFGFKAFAGEKGGYDQAIFSRSIDFQMEQDYPSVMELKTLEWIFNNFRTILLNYRYKTNNPPELPEDIFLKGRNREIYSCIIRTAMHIGIEYQDIINFIQETETEKQQEIENTNEYQVLKVIHDYECQPTLDDAAETISYSDIAEQLGWDPDKRQKLGYIFKKKLILKTKRRNNGSVLLLTDPKNIRKLKSLYRRFKL